MFTLTYVDIEYETNIFS